MSHTVETLTALITARQESDLPDQILAALAPLAGKAITTRLLDKLPGGRDTWRLVREYGWTHLINESYWRTRNGHTAADGVRIMLARSEASVPLDLAFVEAENPAYFAGRRERNADRASALQSPDRLAAVAQAMNAVDAAREALTAAEATLAQLTGWGTVFNPDSHAIEAALVGSGKNGGRS